MKNKNKAFTLIELLIVIAIIGILASIVLVNLNSGRTKAVNASALSSATQLLKIVEMCDLDGGKIVGPANANNGGGNICNKGAAYGTWPVPPAGFFYYTSVWVSGADNMFLVRKTGANPVSDRQIYCGHYALWVNNTNGVGRLGKGFSCAQYVEGVYK